MASWTLSIRFHTRPFLDVDSNDAVKRTTLYYKVLQSTSPYFSLVQSTTSVLLRTTKVLLQYYSELQSTTPVFYSVLQSTTPVLLCTTKYYSILLQYYSVPSSNSGKGPLEVHAISAKVSKGSPPKPDFWAASNHCSKKLHPRSQAASRQACCPALSFGKALPLRFFLDFFSGSGRWGRCIARDNNVPVLLWDIHYGPDYDLRALAKRQFHLRGHLGTPCNSIAARDNPPGPPPLRSNLHVLGLPNLAAHDQKKVNDGNLFMRFSVFILRLLVLHVPFSMENPWAWASRLWLCPAVQKLMRNKNTYQQIVEFCMFAMQWRKSTMFLSVWVQFDNLTHFRCIGAKRGCCKRSGKPHQPLAGTNDAGIWWTRIAEPYPLLLCHKIAQKFLQFCCTTTRGTIWVTAETSVALQLWAWA